MTVPVDELKDLRAKMDDELRGNILSYWMKYAVQPDGRGFYGAVDMDNRPVPGVDKTCVLNARILWTYAAAARFYDNDEYGQVADLAYRVFTEHFLDKARGGFYMTVTCDNEPSDTVKHTYAQAFAIYALCKYYEYRPEPRVMDLIRECFAVIEEKTKDADAAGYAEAFARDWKPIEENRMADNNEPKSMNTHLHVLESYAALYKVWKDEKVKTRLAELLNIFLDHIIRDNGHFGIFFDENFAEVEDSRGICSFGHDIEGSWLLWEAAEILGDETILARLKPIAIKIVDSIDRVAVDTDGGLFLESRRFGSHVRTNKHWWPQAENLVGFMNAYQLSGDEKYWDTAKLIWSFIDANLLDHERGEWFTKLNRLGEPYLIEPADDPSPYYRNDWKVDPWKCPYHNGRMCLEMMARIDSLLG
jgi:cellobiose epimerase